MRPHHSQTEECREYDANLAKQAEDPDYTPEPAPVEVVEEVPAPKTKKKS